MKYKVEIRIEDRPNNKVFLEASLYEGNEFLSSVSAGGIEDKETFCSEIGSIFGVLAEGHFKETP